MRHLIHKFLWYISFHELISFSVCSLLLLRETKPKNPIVSAIPCCLPLREIAQLRVMQIGISRVSEASCCTSIRGMSPISGVFVISHTLVIRGSGPRPSLLSLIPLLASLQPYQLLFCPSPHSSHRTFARPLSSTSSSLPWDLPTLLGVEEKGTLLLLFTWGPEWLSPLETPDRALAVSSEPT